MTKSELKQLIRETIEEIRKKSVSEKPRFSLKKSAYGSDIGYNGTEPEDGS
jgi:hypothetical protein